MTREGVCENVVPPQLLQHVGRWAETCNFLHVSHRQMIFLASIVRIHKKEGAIAPFFLVIQIYPTEVVRVVVPDIRIVI